MQHFDIYKTLNVHTITAICLNSIIFLLNVNFLGFQVSHQTTKVYNTREAIDKYHQDHKSKCQTISHYPVVNMSTNMEFSITI
jgi:hypothetical protein